jgi:Rieske Fe-S protein
MHGEISRRDFIKRTAAGIIIGGVALTVPDIGKMFAGSPKGKVYKTGGEMVIKLSDPQNSALANVGGSILLDDENMLIRTSQTQFEAINLICRHKGCTVELSGDQFVCPCHGSEYDITGKVTHGPSKANLRTWETKYDPDKGTVTLNITTHYGKEDKDETDTTKSK